MTKLIATFLYVGHLRPAPGTWGSLVALPLGLGLMILGGPALLIAATLALLAVGWWAVRVETRSTGAQDPAEFVVDEVVGQWIALWPIAIGAAHVGAAYTALWPGWIAAFLLFRLFDVTKWGPVGWADRRHDAGGVMLDDVIAGLLAALGVVVLAAIAHLPVILG